MYIYVWWIMCTAAIEGTYCAKGHDVCEAINSSAFVIRDWILYCRQIRIPFLHFFPSFTWRRGAFLVLLLPKMSPCVRG
jgi:hypothetical protein